MKHLEQLVAEWNDYRGYSVRRNHQISPKFHTSSDPELNVVAFHPDKNDLVHFIISTNDESWEVKDKRYRSAFEAGEKYIPRLFEEFDLPDHIEQIAIIGFPVSTNVNTLGGGKIITAGELFTEIETELNSTIGDVTVSEEFPMLSLAQFVVQNRSRNHHISD